MKMLAFTSILLFVAFLAPLEHAAALTLREQQVLTDMANAIPRLTNLGWTPGNLSVACTTYYGLVCNSNNSVSELYVSI